MDSSPTSRVTLLSRMKRLLPSRRFRFFFPGARQSAIAQSTIPPPPRYTTASTARPEVTQHNAQSYHELAQRLQRLSPPESNWYGPGSVQIVDAAPFASGGFSDVWKGTFQNRTVAVKSLRCYSSPEFDPAEVGIRFLKELWASDKLSNPNFVRFLGVYSTPTHPFALIYEMMDNADLGQYIAQHPTTSRLKLLTDISRALEYMHGQDITHGNVKSKNVLVDGDNVARLGGLGSAFALSLPASWSDVESQRLFCGFAPELIDPDAFGLVHARATKATDMFAFGMLAWEVFAGKHPFAGNVEAAGIFSLFRNNRPPRPVHPEMTDRVWNMIESCWNQDPFKRMTAADVVDVLEAELF
ncbi:kinase-like domain-containing protein [Thelephora terrestris]|uniref:Kinase-like domain-containing protein n=1 Tax=Thelephora terrestris TaxID=56493 RepID=A0A9P6HRC8_9AGAM|nr:kinase-like domain-containing protein [Thelephora terrestris]